ncbi:hypothetical protein BTO16_10205 [Polaribacter glomeratus]|uniref:Uncharacterized protein n=1 Tax=Polaribacter glomeratus TaxID=102 RepID=A0A2S7WFT8_9FLAO|nr:hypothetical protein BTO16_10205 [Polaribacter glomeratus]TXD63798.1 hypothetical protein ESX12_16890 [Polaribacter glomeratus]
MALVNKIDIIKQRKLVLNEINIKEGSGSFLIEGGKGKKEKAITIYDHKPKRYKPDSKILLVVSGSGRNRDSYRDAWIASSEKYGVLILSPFADKQGVHRLERGTYFFNTSKEIAKKLDFDFNCKLIIVHNTGHDHRKMGVASSKYLHGKKEL